MPSWTKFRCGGPKGISAKDIHARLARARAPTGDHGPSLRAVQRALKGATFRRAKVETRGRRWPLSSANLRALDRARKRLIAKTGGDCEVHWEDIIRAARVPHVDRSTAAKSLKAAGYGVAWRAPRLKPVRGEIDEGCASAYAAS